jgi:hypothetical protein
LTHTHMHARARAHARTHTHTHTQTHARTHTHRYALWSFDLTESHKVQLFEKIVCGKRFGHKRYEVTGN